MDSKSRGSSSFEIRPLNEKEIEEMKIMKGVGNFIRVFPHGYLLREQYKDNLERIFNLEIRSDDVFVMGFPKSGTTLTRELVWLIGNDFDFKTATSVPLQRRVVHIDFHSERAKQVIEQTCHEDSSKNELAAALLWTHNNPFDRCAELPSPRFFKTHLAFSLMPPNILEKSRVVYVARDPRDVAVSFFYHMQNETFDCQIEFKDYWKLFMKNLIMYSPYFAHFQEAWKLKDHPNMLFLFYEELTKDMPDGIRRVAQFLGKPAVTEEQIVKLCEHLKIDNFRNNKMVNYNLYKELGLFAKDGHFIRKGKVGGWRDYFDEEMAREAELWIEEGLRGIDFRFKS